MKISIAGSGYVGLVTAAGLAEMGNHVLCTDVSEERVDSLRKGTYVTIRDDALVVIPNAPAAVPAP